MSPLEIEEYRIKLLNPYREDPNALGVLTQMLDTTLTSLREQVIPTHMWQGVLDYLFYGTPPGDFHRYILLNDLRGAAFSADEYNRGKLLAWARLVTLAYPIVSHTSPDNIAQWIEDGGWVGMVNSREPAEQDSTPTPINPFGAQA